jgi:hypothetical protein
MSWSYQPEPLAFQLYRRFRGGCTVEEMAGELAIPVERIRLRVQAAAACWQRRAEADPAAEPAACLAALDEALRQ